MNSSQRIPSILRWASILLISLLIVFVIALLAWSWYINRQIDAYEIYHYTNNAPGQFARVQGFDIAYQTLGDPAADPTGAPIMLLHGFSSSGQEFQRILPALSEKRDLIVPDMLGYGNSQRVLEPDPAYNHHGQALLIKGLLDQLGVEEVDLVGASYGGGIAAQFALDYPERVRHIVFIDAEVYGEGSNQAFIAYLPFGLNRALTWYALGGGPLSRNLADLACHDIQACEGNNNELSAAREEITRIQGTTDALIAFSKTDRDARVPANLDQLRTPSLVIWGEFDRVIPLESGERLANTLNAQLVIIPDTGHIPHIERPELVVPIILDFLNPDS